MSIVSGLVDTGAERSVAPRRRSATGEWLVRNVWGVILTVSLTFWLALAGLLTLG